MKILAEIEVDEDMVKEAAETDDVEDAIDSELNWINQSGMSVTDWKIVEEQEGE